MFITLTMKPCRSEVLVEFSDGSTIGIRKILHQLAFLQQEDAGGDVGNEVEVEAGDDDRGALLLADLSLIHILVPKARVLIGKD